MSITLHALRKTHFLGRPMPCSWWRIPIHPGPLLEPTALTLTSKPTPHPRQPSWPSTTYFTMTSSTILVFLIWNRFDQKKKKIFQELSLLFSKLWKYLSVCEWPVCGILFFPESLDKIFGKSNFGWIVGWFYYVLLRLTYY